MTVTCPTVLQGQWEVLQTCCWFPLARDSFSFVVELLGTSTGILTWESSTAARLSPQQ